MANRMPLCFSVGFCDQYFIRKMSFSNNKSCHLIYGYHEVDLFVTHNSIEL